MIKKILLAMLALMPLMGSAQLAEGDWKVHKGVKSPGLYLNNIWNEKFHGYKIQETADRVYYCNLGSLGYMDKATNTAYVFTPLGELSDIAVSGIWYNREGKFLFVGYESGNIDLIYDNGKIVNIPQYKEALLTTEKSIRDVAFKGDKMYIGTDFGIIAVNWAKGSIIETGTYNHMVSGLTFVGDNLVVCSSLGPYELRYINPEQKSIQKWDNFTKFNGSFYGNNIRFLTDNKIVARSNVSNVGYCPVLFTLNFNNNTVSSQTLVSMGIDYMSYDADGNLIVVNRDDNQWQINGTKFFVIKKDGTVDTYTLPESAVQKNVTYWESPTNASILLDGVAKMDITKTDDTFIVPTVMPNAPTIKRAIYMQNLSNGGVIFGEMGVYPMLNNGYGMVDGVVSDVNIYKDGQFTNITPKYTTTYQGTYWVDAQNYDLIGIHEDPNNPDLLYFDTFWGGTYVMSRNPVTGKYDVEEFVYNSSNSPMQASAAWASRTGVTAFDGQGNLWMCKTVTYNSATQPYIAYLPADKVNSPTLKKSDWIAVNIPDYTSTQTPQIINSKKYPNLMYISDSNWPSRLTMYDTKGTVDKSDDKFYSTQKPTDEHGEVYSLHNVYCMKEDNQGRMWFGTHKGVFRFDDQMAFVNGNPVCVVPQVLRPDGSGYTDNLLNDVTVFSIDQDADGNMWFGTSTDGVYKTTPDGDQILEQYTAENSSLPVNFVMKVLYDGGSNSMWFATSDGIVQFNANKMPSANDYSGAYAFPNPVRPDYTGWITLKGLVDNSNVVISDASGKHYFVGRSNGGTLIWDGCDQNGQRVKSGVYNVYASPDNTATEPIIKIMVIN